MPQPMVSLSQRRVRSPARDLWVSPGFAKYIANGIVNTVKFPAPSSRPNLDSIDIEATSKASTKSSSLPLTPPLTPASTRTTTTTDSESSTSDDTTHSSPSNSVDISGIVTKLGRNFAAYPSWNNDGSKHRKENVSFQDSFPAAAEDDSMLPSPVSPTRSRQPSLYYEPQLESSQPSRFLFVSGVPRSVASHALKEAFTACGELKGIYVLFQREHGIIVLAFFDLRDTIRAHQQINTRTFFDGVRLASRYISPNDLRDLIGQSIFVNQNDGKININVSFVGPEVEIDALALRNILTSFGDLRVFNVESHVRSFYIEYFDARDALSAMHALNNRVIFGVRLHLALRDGAAAPTSAALPVERAFSPSKVPFPSTESPTLESRPLCDDNESLAELGDGNTTTTTLQQQRNGRPRSFSTSSSPVPQLYFQDSSNAHDVHCPFSSAHHEPPQSAASPAHTPTPNHPRVKTPPQHVHGRRISNIYHFDSVGRTMLELPPTAPRRPRSISVSSDTDSPIAGRLDLPPPSPSGLIHSLPQSPVDNRGFPLPMLSSSSSSSSSSSPYSPPLFVAPPDERQWTHDNDQAYYTAAMAAAVAAEQQQQYLDPVSSPQVASLLHMPRRALTAAASLIHSSPRVHQSSGLLSLGLEVVNERENDQAATAMLPERNKIDIGKIERGEETRTTVMIKNIPNKMSDKNLIDFINDVCPRKIDFLYLRMDFTNGCNVGYAFVNFISVEDLLHFAKTKLGTKWNLFSSEKVLGMSYANYQGKEALVDKFRSSSIMDQRESWRPKLFYSYGPKQGLPEDFPAPTHIRRKERANLLPNELHQTRALFHHHHQSSSSSSSLSSHAR